MDGFDEVVSLIEHRERLTRERENLDLMLATLDRSIEARRGNIKMKDSDKFRGLKKGMVDENERKYGKEARQKFGDESVDRSNEKVLSMSETDHERSSMIATEIITKIHEAMKTGDPDSELAQEAARLHREWLSYYWHTYSIEAHMGLVQMYVEDERFKSFYDSETEGTAAFLRDAVISYLKKQQKKDLMDL